MYDELQIVSKSLYNEVMKEWGELRARVQVLEAENKMLMKDLCNRKINKEAK